MDEANQIDYIQKLLVEARVKIDESGDREFKKELAAYLRRRMHKKRQVQGVKK